MIDRFGRRLAIGLALGAGGVAALAFGLSLWTAGAGASSDRGVEEVPAFELPRSLPRGEAWLLYVAAPGRVLPAAVRPVAEVGPAGEVRITRGAPAPDTPVAEPWLAAGIVLPTERLATLTPTARAALLALLRTWRGTLGRGTEWRAVSWGLTDPEHLAVLARWEQ